jgi:hypothetical protein
MLHELCALGETITKLLLLMIKFKYCVIIFKTHIVYYGLSNHQPQRTEGKVETGILCQISLFMYHRLFLVCIHKVIPLQAWTGLPGGWGCQISRQLAHEGDKVNPTHPAAITPQEIFLVLISVRGRVNPRAIVRPEGLCRWKIPVTPLGIKRTTFWLVAQCLNQLRHSVPQCVSILISNVRLYMVLCFDFSCHVVQDRKLHIPV